MRRKLHIYLNLESSWILTNSRVQQSSMFRFICKEVNAELRPLASVRNHTEKIRLVIEREELRAFTNKDIMKSKARLGGKCKDNEACVFLRSGRDGIRHCPVYEPEHF